MIEVQDLTKAFGEKTAVDGITFSVNKGEILGFLGPNGAGKTTTMRVLTGYLPATQGTAKIAGFDVFDDSMEVRRRIGYLPENPPLYFDMTVASYLDFVARIKNVAPEKRAQSVESAMEMTKIADKRDELIKRLSRGYKQRVGLAQAIVHDPDVIILDEPTVGLDPKQIIEVRHLIKGLAGNHTIILSTHILPEVSMTCDRVIIINNGKIVAVDTPENLTPTPKDRPPWSPGRRPGRSGPRPTGSAERRRAHPGGSAGAGAAAAGCAAKNSRCAKSAGGVAGLRRANDCAGGGRTGSGPAQPDCRENCGAGLAAV